MKEEKTPRESSANTTKTSEPTKATRRRASKKSPLSRDENGLLKNIKYEYLEDGFIDWKKTIPVEHVVPNKEKFRKLKRDIPKDIEEIEDENLIIKLSGLKWAAKIRGYSQILYTDRFIGDGKCAITCSITWMPNFETDGKVVETEEVASATISNTSGFAQNFLESIAANRAFARCVRNFLNINIVSDEEMGPDESEVDSKNSAISEVTPQSIFLKQASEKLGNLDQIVQFVNKIDEVDTEGIEGIEDLKKRISVSAAKKLLKELNQP